MTTSFKSWSDRSGAMPTFHSFQGSALSKEWKKNVKIRAPRWRFIQVRKMATSSYDGGWVISGTEAGVKLNEAFTRALSMSRDDMNVPDFDELLEKGRKHLESWKNE